jgi:hypothetical protein
MNDECGQHIGEQTEREPLQEIRDSAVADQDGAEPDDDAEEDNVIMRIQAAEHFRRVRHGGEIGADGDRVRD